MFEANPSSSSAGLGSSMNWSALRLRALVEREPEGVRSGLGLREAVDGLMLAAFEAMPWARIIRS